MIFFMVDLTRPIWNEKAEGKFGLLVAWGNIPESGLSCVSQNLI
jgi:hypothetical protein